MHDRRVGAAGLSPATIKMVNTELAAMVDRFVLAEQAKPHRPTKSPSHPLAALTELLDAGTDNHR